MNWGDARLPRRFWDKVVPEPNSGCWLWIGSHGRHGYGQIKWPGRVRVAKAHRLTVAVVANIPDGMTVDHKCQTTMCVNPHHCQAVSLSDNAKLQFVRRPELRRRSPGRAARTQRAHCTAGHDLSVVGRVGKSGRCRICFAASMREYRARKRAG